MYLLRLLLNRFFGHRALGYRRGYFSDSKTRHRKVFLALTKGTQAPFFGGTNTKKTDIMSVFFVFVPPVGLEPTTVSLKGYCSTS